MPPHEDDDADTSSVHKDDIRESVMRSLDTIESEDAPLPPSAIEAHHDTEKKRKLAGYQRRWFLHYNYPQVIIIWMMMQFLTQLIQVYLWSQRLRL